MDYKNLIPFICIFLFSLSANGQNVYSLEACIEQAIDKSITLEQADLAVRNAELIKEQSYRNRYPNLSGNGGLNYNFGRSIDPTTNTFIQETFSSNSYGLNSGVLLYGGRRLKHAIEQAGLDVKAFNEDKNQAKADIALRVATAYLNALFAEENIKLARSQFNQSEEQLELVNKLIAAGARSTNENLDILALISTNKQSIIAAENAKDIALLQLKQLMRIAPDSELQIIAPSGIELETDPDLITFGEAYKMTLTTQPAIKAAELREQAANYTIKLAESDLYPTLTLGGNIRTAYSNQGRNLAGFETEQINQSALINEECNRCLLFFRMFLYLRRLILDNKLEIIFPMVLA